MLKVAWENNGLCFGRYIRDVFLRDDLVKEIKFIAMHVIQTQKYRYLV